MEIILGDNPFFGVNHRSQEQAAKYLDEKGDFSNAVEVIRAAQSVGVNKVMLSNHADLIDLLKKLREVDPAAADRIEIALVVPYAQKFNQIVGSEGVIGIIKEVPFFQMARSGATALLSALFGRQTNIEGLIDILVQMELACIGEFEPRVKALCVHNIVADLCLGLNKLDFVVQFCRVVRKRGYSPVVITQNPIPFDNVLPADVALCFSYNVAGFMVNPSLAEVRESLGTSRELWAMAILASGAASLEQAMKDEFLKKFSAVLYATSKPSRALQSIPALRESTSQL